MRYGMSILALVAVLALGAVVQAESIALWVGTGLAPGTGNDHVTAVDDLGFARNSTAVIPDASSGNPAWSSTTLTFQTNFDSASRGNPIKFSFVGFADMFALLPATSGGGTLVIDNATLRLGTASNMTTIFAPIVVAEVDSTNPWLAGTAGTNEININADKYDQAAFTAAGSGFDWVNETSGKFMEASFDTTNSDEQVPPAGLNSLMDFDVTAILDHQYHTTGVNTGFVLWAPDFKINDSSTKPSFHSSEATTTNASAARPQLLIDYHYDGGAQVPEPGTMLLLGSGVLGMIGYMKRKRMA